MLKKVGGKKKGRGEEVLVLFFLYKGGGGGGGYTYRLSVPVCGEWGGGIYDLNIESKINLAGNAIIIYVIDY